MSTYRALTKHPETNSYTWAEWRDDHFGPRHYGVRFDGENKWHDPKDKFLKVIDLAHEAWYQDPIVKKSLTLDVNFTKRTLKDQCPVNAPAHYNDHPSGVECIEITRHMSFNLGNAIKYLWRHGKKDPEKTIEDLRKAVFYIEDEIERLTPKDDE